MESPEAQGKGVCEGRPGWKMGLVGTWSLTVANCECKAEVLGFSARKADVPRLHTGSRGTN